MHGTFSITSTGNPDDSTPERQTIPAWLWLLIVVVIALVFVVK